MLNAKGTVGHGSGIEGYRCGIESRFRLFLDRVVMDMSDLDVSGYIDIQTELTYRSASQAIKALDACVTLNRVSNNHVGQVSSFRIAEMFLPVTEVKARARRSLGSIGRARDDSVVGVSGYSSKTERVGVLGRGVRDGSINSTRLSASLNMRI